MLDHGILLHRRWSPSVWTGSSSWLRTKWSQVREGTKKKSHCRKFQQKFFTTTMPGTTNWKDDEDENNAVSSSSPTVSSTIPRLGRGVCVGQYANTTRTYRRHEVTNFARLLHDFNPIHGTNMNVSSSSSTTTTATTTDKDKNHNHTTTTEDESYQKAGLVREGDESSSLVQGMFVAGIFSSLFAALAPGCIYLNQTLEFVAPVFVNNNNDTNNNNNNDTTGDDRVIGCLQIEKIRPMRRTKGGIVVHCHTRVYKQPPIQPPRTSRDPPQPQPQPAQLVIHGRATVWLPLGYARTMTTTMTPPQS